MPPAALLGDQILKIWTNNISRHYENTNMIKKIVGFLRFGSVWQIKNSP
jgi:hypothetical protein